MPGPLLVTPAPLLSPPPGACLMLLRAALCGDGGCSPPDRYPPVLSLVLGCFLCSRETKGALRV